MAERGRRPGRPPLKGDTDAPSAQVTVRLAASDYDRAHKLATKCRQSVNDLLRLGLKRLLDDERGGTV